VEELVETKRQGGVIETAPRPARSSNVVDLLEALQASVEDAGRPGVGPDQAAAGAKRASKRSTAASKAPARSSAKRDRVGAVPATVAKKSTARKPAAKKATTGSTPRRKAS